MSRPSLQGVSQERSESLPERRNGYMRYIDTGVTEPDIQGVSKIVSRQHGFRSSDTMARSPASSTCTDDTSSSCFNGPATEIPGFAGWTSSPRLQDAWASRTTLNTNQSNESPITPISPTDDLFSRKGFSSSITSFSQEVSKTVPAPFSLPYRQKRDIDEFEVTPSGLTAGLGVQREREPTPTMLTQNRQSPEICKSDAFDDNHEITENLVDSDEAFTSTEHVSHDPVESVLRYTLQEAFDSEQSAANRSMTTCHAVVRDFISNLSWALDQDKSAFREAAGVHRNATNASTSTTITRSSQHSSTSSSRSDMAKRKTRAGKKLNEGNDEDDSDEDQDLAERRGSVKRAKVESLRMTCPYRKKNPLRFNVRDHRLCALTVFYNTSELR